MDLNEGLRPISYKKNAMEAVVGRAVFHQIGNGGSTPKKSPKMGGACDGLWRKGRASTREASGETDSRRGQWGGWVQYEKGNKPENKGGKIFALCFMGQKVIELDYSTGSVW